MSNYNSNDMMSFLSSRLKEEDLEVIERDAEEYYWNDCAEEGSLITPLTAGSFPTKDLGCFISGLDNVLSLYFSGEIRRCDEITVYCCCLYQYSVSQQKDYFGDDYSALSLALCLSRIDDLSLRQHYARFLNLIYKTATVESELSVFSWIGLKWLQISFSGELDFESDLESYSYDKEYVLEQCDFLINERCQEYWREIVEITFKNG